MTDTNDLSATGLPAASPSHDADFYEREYNARATIPDHPRIFTRWQKESAQVRRTSARLLDIAYGDAAGERLDLFPARKAGAPLLVFIHGGWWRSLDKADFSFVVPPFLAAGCNVALTNYTLAPHASIQEIVMQQLRALAWLYRNAEHYDVDRERIIVAGHSAGAHLAAMAMAALWPQFGDDLPRDLVKGGILLSGLYELSPVVHASFVNGDLKLDADNVGPLSPARMTPAHPIPFLTSVGGKESSEFKRQTALIGAAWNRTHRGEIPAPQWNHLTICEAFSTPGDPLCDASTAFVGQWVG